MIAADTSSLVAYLNGAAGADVEKLYQAAASGGIAVPAVVITELLSDPAEGTRAETQIEAFAILPIASGYWNRAGATRRGIMRRGFKAKLGDALIAQACIDNDVALITRDDDFRHFAKYCGLKLA